MAFYEHAVRFVRVHTGSLGTEKDFQKLLDHMSTLGWELVSTTAGEMYPSGTGIFFFFKRFAVETKTSPDEMEETEQRFIQKNAPSW